MTASEAAAAGYQIVRASPFEVGLVKGETGIKTWFARDFSLGMPDLDHPLVWEAIEVNERTYDNQRS